MNETKEYRSINQSAVDAAINIESEDRLIKESVLLRNCLVPSSEIDCSYERKDVFIRDGLIEQIVDAQTFDLLKERERDQLAADTDRTHAKVLEIDCTDRMITPGLVNGHTHSVEHWLRGAIPPLPLEMWIFQLILNEPRGERGWFKERSWMETPSAMIAISALLCGIETLLSGSTVIMDHLLCRNLEDVEAAVTAYKALGIRCFIAPMLNDDATMYHNYVPLARDGDLRQMKCQGCGCCGGLDKNGCFRTKKSEYSLEGRASMLKLWEDAVKKFHDPENGVNIAIGPVTCFSASYGMLEGAAELRRKYNL